MKHINNFSDFHINEEWSRNDAVPELRMNGKLGIILLGAPGVGKSTFISKYILPRNQNIKTFSTDDVSLSFTKDPNVYYQNSSILNIKRIKLHIDSGKSFIYDTTGTSEHNVKDIYNYSKKHGYTTIIIHLVAPLDVSLMQNSFRDRNADINYVLDSYEKQYLNMSKYYRELKPDGYYIVQYRKPGGFMTNAGDDVKYIFSKYVDNKIIRNKNTYLRLAN